MSMGEMEECMKNRITLHESIREKQRLAKIAKEERKEKNKYKYEKEKIEKELQKAQETIQKQEIEKNRKE